MILEEFAIVAELLLVRRSWRKTRVREFLGVLEIVR